MGHYSSASDPLMAYLSSPDPVSRFMHEKVHGAQRTLAGDPALRALMFAVLQDAIACFESGNARLVQEEEEWMSVDDDGIFSFNNVCETLGFNPEALRRGLLRWKANRERVPPEGRKRLISSKGKRSGKEKKRVNARPLTEADGR